MDISSTLRPVSPGVSPATVGAAATAGAAAPTPALQDLASLVLDKSGQTSDGDKLSAYNASYRMAVTGQFRNLAPEDRQVLNQIGNSDTAQAVKGARAAYEGKMVGAMQQAAAKGTPHSQALGAAAVAHFDSLGDHDQKLLFSSLNAPDRTGATPFTGVDEWRGQMASMGGVASRGADRVELSDAARAAVSNAPPPAGAAQAPVAYVSGSLTNVRI